MLQREVRSFNFDFEVRADEGQDRIVTGYAAVFDSPSQPLWGEWREVIAPGAFAETLAAPDDIYALWNHNANEPIASRDAGTLKLSEDKRGLRTEIHFGDSDIEKYWHSKIKDKTIKKMSFGFSPEEEGVDYDAKIRTLMRIRLYEVSPVTWPAYQGTSISARGYAQPEDIFSRFIPAPASQVEDARVVGMRLRQLALREKTLAVA